MLIPFAIGGCLGKLQVYEQRSEEGSPGSSSPRSYALVLSIRGLRLIEKVRLGHFGRAVFSDQMKNKASGSVNLLPIVSRMGMQQVMLQGLLLDLELILDQRIY